MRNHVWENEWCFAHNNHNNSNDMGLCLYPFAIAVCSKNSFKWTVCLSVCTTYTTYIYIYIWPDLKCLGEVNHRKFNTNIDLSTSARTTTANGQRPTNSPSSDHQIRLEKSEHIYYIWHHIHIVLLPCCLFHCNAPKFECIGIIYLFVYILT